MKRRNSSGVEPNNYINGRRQQNLENYDTACKKQFDVSCQLEAEPPDAAAKQESMLLHIVDDGTLDCQIETLDELIQNMPDIKDCKIEVDVVDGEFCVDEIETAATCSPVPVISIVECEPVTQAQEEPNDEKNTGITGDEACSSELCLLLQSKSPCNTKKPETVIDEKEESIFLSTGDPGNGTNDEIVLDTVKLVNRIKSNLAALRVSQKQFAESITGRSPSTVSGILNNPKPWSELSSCGRAVYLDMWKWLQKPHDMKQLCLSSPVNLPSKKKKRRKTIFTPLQQQALTAIYKHTQRPSKNMENVIASEMGLEVSTVADFFKNARSRWKNLNDFDKINDFRDNPFLKLQKDISREQ